MANYPTIKFVDDRGNVLPTDEDGLQHIQQFRQFWQVCLSDRWLGKVRLLGNPNIDLLNVAKTNYWQFKNNQIPPSIISSAGIVTIILIDDKGNQIEATKTRLAIHPASLTDSQLDRMIADIGTLALSVSSCVNREIKILTAQASGETGYGQKWSPYQGMLTTADALIELTSVMQQNWIALEKRSLKDIETTIGKVNRSRVYTSPKLLIKAYSQPAKQNFMGMVRTETTNCSENQFLCYLLDIYLQDVAQGVISSLKALKIDNVESRLIPSRRSDSDFTKFRDNIQKTVNQRTKRINQFELSVKEKIKQLQECQIWAKYARNSSFLRNISTPHTLPNHSLRLTGAPAYGAIYACYSSTQGHLLENLQQQILSFENLTPKNIKPVWEIYEIWCFVSIYSAFILYAGMSYEPSEGLFENLTVSIGTIQIPKNRPFRLSKKLGDRRQLTVTLTYESEQYNLYGKLRKPDILIEVSINGMSVSKFGFDAKYRNYRDQGYDRFQKDVIDIAKSRYQEELKLQACFVLHTDRNYDYWGEVPFSRFAREKFRVSQNKNDYVGHQYGAIALFPDSDPEKANQQLKKIIRLLLQYHLHESLISTCISCGYSLAPQENIFRQGLSTYYGCPQCGDFWVVNSCYGTHHHLLKFSNYFHHKSDHPEHRDKWMFICPECGSDPSEADLRNTGSYRRSY
ncbi:nuclease domain-containing protein [Pseudanabaena mucicola]|uniref:nuclease domain-containing protein n=1 Tax=Pseudanabaena mucicola TaxID=71190 RepID=UPI0025752BDF|nr:nuclease domain-containing protein [Pseudanabaena mucicola]